MAPIKVMLLETNAVNKLQELASLLVKEIASNRVAYVPTKWAN